MKFDSIQISKATEHNWKRLGSNHNSKLITRANKTLSPKRIVATNYLNSDCATSLLNRVLTIDAPAEDIMYTLSILYLKWANIFEKRHVQDLLNRYSHLNSLDISVPQSLWSHNEDVLGFIYQSMTAEGERICTGQYYTSKDVVKHILNGKTLADGETFLDPCCGSGAFLLGVDTTTPTCLYGFDIDPIAVLITSVNLLVKYSDHEFTPNIYCLDYLKKDMCYSMDNSPEIPPHFDNVYTNPPWGADRADQYSSKYPELKSKERSCMFIIESLHRLNTNGELCFLLPSSILKTKTHKDLRKYIISNTRIRKIDLFCDRFNGVYTDYFSIRLTARKTDRQSYEVSNGHYTAHIELSDNDYSSGNIRTNIMSQTDKDIIDKIESQRHDDLTHSYWALGIVTGDNKNIVKNVPTDGLEPVYTGKEVLPFNLSETTSYIHFNPESFQQCAKEEFYRAPEKLLYRFIAKYPIVAYDDKQCLCLNSANIVIPELDGISVRNAAALLNSTLYRYYYCQLFSDIKVLKSNLQRLPFPKLSQKQSTELSKIVSSIRQSGFSEGHQSQLDEIVYRIFGINPSEQDHIKESFAIIGHPVRGRKRKLSR